MWPVWPNHCAAGKLTGVVDAGCIGATCMPPPDPRKLPMSFTGAANYAGRIDHTGKACRSTQDLQLVHGRREESFQRPDGAGVVESAMLAIRDLRPDPCSPRGIQSEPHRDRDVILRRTRDRLL